MINMRQSPDYMVFDLMEEYATYIFNYPKFSVPRGSVYVFRVRELDAVWFKVGDGEKALIDLPNIIGQ